MSAEPMLGECGGYGTGRGSACRSLVARCWATTTSQKYMASPASRRNLWLIYGVVVAAGIIWDLVNLFTGVRSELSALDAVIEGSELCLSLLLVCLPAKTLMSDTILFVCFTVQFLTYLVHPLNWTNVAMTLVAKVFLCHALGVHSLAVIGFASCSMFVFLARWPVGGPEGLQAVISSLFVISSVMTLFEWLLASSFLELGEHIAALQNLLDNTAEGYCTVTRHTGIVTHVSKGLQEIFGREMLGAHVLDFVDHNDHERVRCLYEYGQLSMDEPVLATFLQKRLEGGLGASELDARLVPYRVTGADVQISFQTVGEVRMTRGLVDGADGSAEPEEPGQAAARTGDRQCTCCYTCPCLEGGSVGSFICRRPVRQGVACMPVDAGDRPAAREREAPGCAPGGPPDAGDDLRSAFVSGHQDADASSSTSSAAPNDIDRQQHVSSVSVVVDVFSKTLKVKQMVLHFSADSGAADKSSMIAPGLADWLHADELEYTREWLVESAKARASGTSATATGHGPIRFYCGQKTFAEAADVQVDRLDVRSKHWRGQAKGECIEEEDDEEYEEEDNGEEGEEQEGGEETDDDHDGLSEVDVSQGPSCSLNIGLRLTGITKMFWPPWSESRGYYRLVKHAIKRHVNQAGLSKRRRSLRPIAEQHGRCTCVGCNCACSVHLHELPSLMSGDMTTSEHGPPKPITERHGRCTCVGCSCACVHLHELPALMGAEMTASEHEPPE
jgi:hypothetical protein